MKVFRKRFVGVIGLLALAGGALVGVVSPVSVSSVSAASVDLTFLGTNDFHGRIDANTVKWAGTIEQNRTANTLFVAGGDLVGASLFASAVANDDPTIDVLNALLLDSSSVGNHEFDKGFTDLTTHLEPRADWTYLCANCYNAGTTTPALPEFTIKTVGGVTVGMIGAVTQETPTLVSPSGVANLSFGDPVDAITRVAQQLSDGNAGNGEAMVIIAMYHEGAPLGAPATLAQEMAASTVYTHIVNDTSAAVDAIFTGHTHKAHVHDAPIPGVPGKTRPIVQAGNYGDQGISKVVLTVDDVTGEVTAHTQVLVPRTTVADADLTATFPRVATVKTIVDAALANAATVGNVAVGSVTADITTAFSGGTYVGGKYTGGTRDDRAKESTLGNVVADALVAALDDPLLGGAEIGVVNPGGLRAELLKGTDSIISFAEANSVLPFANNLHTISLTGAQFKTLLEQQWQRDAAGNVPTRPFLHLGLSKNVSYTFDPSLAEGSRITSIVISGIPIDPARNYRIGTFSFLTDGGDNFRIFRSGTNKKDSGLVDRDAWIQYIRDSSPLSPSYARRAVQVSPMPTKITSGGKLTFTVSGLDLTSLGSPENKTIEGSIGGPPAAQQVAIFGPLPVTNGTATIDITVPGGVFTGNHFLNLIAKPSNTIVSIPVTVVRSFTPIEPNRLFDTRPGAPPALRTVKVTPEKVGGTNILTVKVTDIPGLIPAAGVGAVSLNVAVTNVEGDGFVTVYSCGPRKEVANVNFLAGETVSNAVIAPVSPEGNVCFFSLSMVDLVVDINGWFSTASGFNAIEPNRVFDARADQSPAALRTVPKTKIVGDPALEVKFTDLGTAGALVPAAGVNAVSINLAVANAGVDGFVTVYPCNARKLVASINFRAGEIVSNAVIAPLSAGGSLCFYSPVAVDIIVDINGWFAAGSGFFPNGPNRLFDTRKGESPDALRKVAKVKVSDDPILEVKVTGLPGVVPATGVGAVALNVAVTNPETAGFVTVFPCGQLKAVASVNYGLGETVSNLVIAPVSATGTICFYGLSPTDIVVDINGWFVSTP